MDRRPGQQVDDGPDLPAQPPRPGRRPGPAYSLGYDMLPHENMVSKQELLEQAARDRWRIVLDHEPGDPVVRVVPHPDHAGRFSLETVAGT